jgi:hypothetical protein
MRALVSLKSFGATLVLKAVVLTTVAVWTREMLH